MPKNTVNKLAKRIILILDGLVLWDSKERLCRNFFVGRILKSLEKITRL